MARYLDTMMRRKIRSFVTMVGIRIPHRKLPNAKFLLYVVSVITLLYIISRNFKSKIKHVDIRLQEECQVSKTVRFMKKKVLLNQDPICEWLEDMRFESQVTFINYGRKFARLSNVVINSSFVEERRGGGEKIRDVLNQKEQDEYLKLQRGYFNLKCATTPRKGFDKDDHLSTWNSLVTCRKETSTYITGKGKGNRRGKPILKGKAKAKAIAIAIAKAKATGIAKPKVKGVPNAITIINPIDLMKAVYGMTLAIQRYEYANLYHAMTDFYNAFLMILIFNHRPDNVTVLWVDSHPQGGFDDTWHVLFGDTIRAGNLHEPVKFVDMVWSIMGYNSPLHEHYRPSVPYLEEFREFFLSRHRVPTKKKLNCNKLNILFIWRRDYVAHPRNPKGYVNRKISNEAEIISSAREAFPTHNIAGVQLDILTMKRQLELISRTDILVGMHGAGLSHTLFLPKHAGLIELYPIYWSQSNTHFKAMASWRGLIYESWKNYNMFNENWNHFTYIPTSTVRGKLLDVKDIICSQTKK